MDPKVQEKVDAAKAAGHTVLRIKLSGQDFIYRSVNRKEFRDLQNKISKEAADYRDTVLAEADKKEEKISEAEIEAKMTAIRERGEDKLVLVALISPDISKDKDMDSLPAGIITSLSELILQASGFGVEAQPEQL